MKNDGNEIGHQLKSGSLPFYAPCKNMLHLDMSEINKLGLHGTWKIISGLIN